MLLIDTHAHLFCDEYKGRLDEVLQRAGEAGVGTVICVGLDLPTSEASIALAEAYPNVWAAVGVHPHDAGDAPPDILQRLETLAANEKVVAIGETGLDYVRDISPPEVQRSLFQGQLELARSLELPAIVHNRRADGDLLAVMQAVGHRRGVLHCFSSTADFARQALDFGFHISFTGTVTYPKGTHSGGKNRNEAVLEAVGLGHVMVETDCPYLAPVPHRGKTNEPAFVRHIAEKIAGICGTTLEEVARITTVNARKLFTRLNQPGS